MAKRIKTELNMQYAGVEVSDAAIIGKIKKNWVDDGHLVKEIDSIHIYVKPEEGMVYYVVNRDSETEETTYRMTIESVLEAAAETDAVDS